MKKIFITGGHLTSAIAVAQGLTKRNWEIIYVGRKYALEGDLAVSEEYKTVLHKGYKFLPIVAGRIQRTFTRYTLWSIIKIPIGFLQALFYLLKYRPEIILSFGGYVALPVAIMGWFFGIAVITHEQTLSMGLSNKIISKFAKKILAGWEKNLGQFPSNKTILVGMPVRNEIFQVIKKFALPLNRPIIYITGGNLGAHSINTVIEQNLNKLLNSYTVIHQCGDTKQYHDFERLQEIKRQLPSSINKYYFIFKYITDDYIGWVLNKADVIITRAGANIITEIIRLQKPAIFIPLPWSGENEQFENARYLEERNAGLIINQNELTKELLFQNIENIFKQKEQIKLNLKKLNNKIIQNAVDKIVRIIETEGC